MSLPLLDIPGLNRWRRDTVKRVVGITFNLMSLQIYSSIDRVLYVLFLSYLPMPCRDIWIGSINDWIVYVIDPEPNGQLGMQLDRLVNLPITRSEPSMSSCLESGVIISDSILWRINDASVGYQRLESGIIQHHRCRYI